MKLFNFYSDEELVDYTWYQSSNIVFSKCIDNPNALKTLIVVFSNGGTYQYSDVPVQKYLEFREASSQGKALNEIIKSKEYPYTKLGNSNLEVINEDYIHRTGRGYYYSNAEKFVLTDYQNKEVYSSSTPLNEESLNVILDVFKAVGIIVKEKKNLL